jgi:hypothetical protein
MVQLLIFTSRLHLQIGFFHMYYEVTFLASLPRIKSITSNFMEISSHKCVFDEYDI